MTDGAISILRARSGSIKSASIDARTSAVSADYRPQALIVDDCRFIAERVARALEDKGFECTLVGDGFAGLGLARVRRFDLFVLDVDMPCLDGFTLLDQLRGDPVHARTPVLMLAAEPSEVDRSRALQLASTYMSKPLQLRPLSAMIDSMTG